jgi:hypothetical protein
MYDPATLSTQAHAPAREPFGKPAPSAFKPREVKSAASQETERRLAEYERTLAARR